MVVLGEVLGPGKGVWGCGYGGGGGGEGVGARVGETLGAMPRSNNKNEKSKNATKDPHDSQPFNALTTAHIDAMEPPRRDMLSTRIQSGLTAIAAEAEASATITRLQ